MRTDYYNDPNAPAPNSVVPSASAIVTDEHGRILLIKRRDNTLWALPGGGHDIGETIADTAVREVKEETGLDVKVTGLVGVYTNPRHVVAFTDGEVRQQFSLLFTTTVLGGTLAIDHETVGQQALVRRPAINRGAGEQAGGNGKRSCDGRFLHRSFPFLVIDGFFGNGRIRR